MRGALDVARRARGRGGGRCASSPGARATASTSTTPTIPQEAGLNERAVSFTKGCYVGQETVARLHYRGKPNRHLRGLRLSAPVADRHAAASSASARSGGWARACVSPRLGPIALALVRREAAVGDELVAGVARSRSSPSCRSDARCACGALRSAYSITEGRSPAAGGRPWRVRARPRRRGGVCRAMADKLPLRRGAGALASEAATLVAFGAKGTNPTLVGQRPTAEPPAPRPPRTPFPRCGSKRRAPPQAPRGRARDARQISAHLSPRLDPAPRRDVEAGVRRVALLILAVLALVPAAAAAKSNDSLAPPDAPPHWLPPEAWVYNHWLPYDEGRLYALLHITREQLWQQLRDDHRNVAQLAARHGWRDPGRLADALVAPWRGHVSAARARGAARRARCARSRRATSPSTCSSTRCTSSRSPRARRRSSA